MAILACAEYSRLVSMGSLASLVKLEGRVAWPAVPWIVTDSVPAAPESAVSDPLRLLAAVAEQGQQQHLPPDATAFLQYTSGSTGDPKVGG